MTVILNGGAGVTYPDGVQQTNAVTNTGGDPRYYAARAWVVFNGSTTPPAIIAGANVASVTRRSTGLFTITFTTAMPDTNYAVAGMAYDGVSNAYVVSQDTTPTSAAFYVRVTSLSASAGTASTSNVSADRVSLAVFR